MQDNRNMILFIVLSAIILFGWSVVSDRFFPTAGPQTQEVDDGEVEGVALPEADPAADSPAALREVADVLGDGGDAGRIAIRTPRLEGSISLAGLRFDDLTLTEERQDLRDDSPPVRLLSPAGAPQSYFASFGWTAQGADAPGPDTVWEADGDVLTPETPVTLSWSNDSGQTFTQTVSVDDNYLFSIRQRVENRGSGAIGVQPYALIRRDEEPEERSIWTVHIGPMGVFDGVAEYDFEYDDLDDIGAGGEEFTSKGGWVGFTDKYWLTALVPDPRSSVTAKMRAPRDDYQVDYMAQQQLVAPGTAFTANQRFFAGAKDKGLLDGYEAQGVERLTKAIDWGWFEWFMRPIFDLLRFLFLVTGNFGVAILALTFLVRLAMFPIANKQFRSMAGMRRIQPKLKSLQERYKDDKPRLQQEMLKLYQAEKINPVAGCLPILIQIPIFYALYKVLLVSVEMRHQPFALWIQDLSAPDPMTPVNLFGLLNFTPPSFIAIGILPILLGISMWLQFRLNPMPQDPMQKQIFGIMPWVLMVIMAPFAAGLQLYWVFSNILTIAQQKWLYRRYDLEQNDQGAAVAKT